MSEVGRTVGRRAAALPRGPITPSLTAAIRNGAFFDTKALSEH